jgi:NAD(P)-dependent dehydrogenase (short-subunit alcohol dehydrogenase family)
MKVIVVGGRGQIGGRIVEALSPNHEVIPVGSRSGSLRVDYTDSASILRMFESVGAFEALILVVGGDSVFRSFDELTDDDFRVGFERKFLGQLNLVRLGQQHASDGASFTLSSGFLSHYPNPSSAAWGPFNAAVDCAVQTIAPLLPKRLRLNVVSPAPVVDAGSLGRGLVTAEQAAVAYVECVEGDFTGRVVRVWGGLEDEDGH